MDEKTLYMLSLLHKENMFILEVMSAMFGHEETANSIKACMENYENLYQEIAEIYPTNVPTS